MTTRSLSIDAATALATGALMRCNTGRAQAESTARALIEAELIGQDGHGLGRVPTYAPQALSGKVDGRAVPRLARVRPGAIAVDARHGFAYPAIDLALEHLPPLVRAQGLGLAGIRASHHAGAVGVFVEKLARDGLVALMTVNTPAAIAPWGGGAALYGTNPIAFAAPVPGAEPLVIDLSLSKVARGRIATADRKGEAIPEGWALDAEGRPTTDPAAALAGTMLPAGDAKGAMLALMVEILAAALPGANFAFEAESFFEAEGPAPGTGQVILAIDPGALRANGLDRIAVMAAAVEGRAGARLPGRRRQRLRAERLRDGLEVDAALCGRIEALGR